MYFQTLYMQVAYLGLLRQIFPKENEYDQEHHNLRPTYIVMFVFMLYTPVSNFSVMSGQESIVLRGSDTRTQDYLDLSTRPLDKNT